MNGAIRNLEDLPISSRLFRQAHSKLLSGTRGSNKFPGEYRRSQNWIGGSSLQNAVFIPPVWQDVDPLMGDLEKFLHNTDTGLTDLIKIAIAHYQFETVHPFLDGNGRIGRLMITLYMVEKNILKKPVLYLSDFFEKNKTLYYDKLTRARTDHDLLGWVKFFLTGIIQTSENSIRSLKDILALKKECEEKRIYTLGKKVGSAKILLDHLFHAPMLGAEEVAKATDLSLVSSYKLIQDFIKLGILVEATGYKRNQIFGFAEYFSIFKK
jgi:Fic family protein